MSVEDVKDQRLDPPAEQDPPEVSETEIDEQLSDLRIAPHMEDGYQQGYDLWCHSQQLLGYDALLEAIYAALTLTTDTYAPKMLAVQREKTRELVRRMLQERKVAEESK